MTAPKLTNAQKRELGWALLNRVADFAEFPELFDRFDGLDGVDRDAMLAQLATWLKAIPSDYWDERLPRPTGEGWT